MKATGTVDTIHETSAALHVAKVKFNDGGFAKIHVKPGELKAGDAVEISTVEKAKK